MPAGRGREPPAVIRADDVTARDDSVSEVAAAMHTLPLHREVTVTVEADDHRHAFDLDADYIAGLDRTDFGHGVPRHLRPSSTRRARSRPDRRNGIAVHRETRVAR